MNVYMLLDRTGSMAAIWAETLSSINSYVEKLGTDKVDAKFTLAMFDSHEGTQFDIIRKSTDVKEWKPITEREASPRGYTPLYDAIGIGQWSHPNSNKVSAGDQPQNRGLVGVQRPDSVAGMRGFESPHGVLSI